MIALPIMLMLMLMLMLIERAMLSRRFLPIALAGPTGLSRSLAMNTCTVATKMLRNATHET